MASTASSSSASLACTTTITCDAGTLATSTWWVRKCSRSAGAAGSAAAAPARTKTRASVALRPESSRSGGRKVFGCPRKRPRLMDSGAPRVEAKADDPDDDDPASSRVVFPDRRDDASVVAPSPPLAEASAEWPAPSVDTPSMRDGTPPGPPSPRSRAPPRPPPAPPSAPRPKPNPSSAANSGDRSRSGPAEHSNLRALLVSTSPSRSTAGSSGAW